MDEEGDVDGYGNMLELSLRPFTDRDGSVKSDTLKPIGGGRLGTVGGGWLGFSNKPTDLSVLISM